MRILLAEDDSNTAAVVQLALENLGGHQVVRADNGDLAVEFAQKDDFDLILLDGNMPGKTGLEVCQILRGQNSALPIILLSGNSTHADQKQALQAGATGFIAKPFTPTQICQDIDHILEKSKSASKDAS